MTASIQTLTLADARILIAAGEAKAKEIGVPYNIAVADAGGNLIAHVRMDGAWMGSIDISISKAFSARAFDMSTDALSGASQSGQSLFGINTTNGGKIVVFGGGVPIKIGDAVVGAVGASGGSVANDIIVAEAAAAAFTG
ncbi:heme-binding protein [Sphingosinicellaceae bacterium]|nr:heme-binding protein [Sphingosinicellaceae bacterium]